MSCNVIFHHALSGETLDDLVDLYYPEFSEGQKRSAIMGGIRGMNEHTGLLCGDYIPHKSWVVLPYPDSYLYKHVATSASADKVSAYTFGQAYFPKYIALEKEQKEVALGHLNEQGAKESLSTKNVLSLSYEKLFENLEEHPYKSLLKEFTMFLTDESEILYEVYTSLKAYDKALRNWAWATKIGQKSVIQEAEVRVSDAFEKVNEVLPKAIKDYLREFSKKSVGNLEVLSKMRGIKTLLSEHIGKQFAQQALDLDLAGKFSAMSSKAFIILNSSYLRWIGSLNFTKYIKSAGKFFLDIPFRTYEVYKTYEEHGDWKVKAGEEVAGYSVGTPVGIEFGKLASQWFMRTISGVVAGGEAAGEVGLVAPEFEWLIIPVGSIVGGFVGDEAVKSIVAVGVEFVKENITIETLKEGMFQLGGGLQSDYW